MKLLIGVCIGVGVLLVLYFFNSDRDSWVVIMPRLTGDGATLESMHLELNAPLNTWTRGQTFSSEADCEAFRLSQGAAAGGPITIEGRPWQQADAASRAGVAFARETIRQSRCVPIASLR